MAAPTCLGITLPSSGSIPSAFWEMLNWGAVDRILQMGVLCLVTCVCTVYPSHSIPVPQYTRATLYPCHSIHVLQYTRATVYQKVKYCNGRDFGQFVIQSTPLIINTDNVINRLLLSKISGPKTLHLKSIKNKPFIIINPSVIVIKLKIIWVHI
jgi:hypothetical protein